jgi:hypothetical protein
LAIFSRPAWLGFGVALEPIGGG